MAHDNATTTPTTARTICPQRFAALSTAVELEVDEDELWFESEAEHELWLALRQEFERLVERIGPIWVAD